MDLAEVNKQVTEIVSREVEDAGQMTLGSLISSLERLPADLRVWFGWGGLAPGDFNSYRGYYDHLAIDPTSHTSTTVANLLAAARSCMGRRLCGWKGGEYLMHENTPLWVARRGESTGTRVIGVTQKNEWSAVIITSTDDDAI